MKKRAIVTTSIIAVLIISISIFASCTVGKYYGINIDGTLNKNTYIQLGLGGKGSVKAGNADPAKFTYKMEGDRLNLDFSSKESSVKIPTILVVKDGYIYAGIGELKIPLYGKKKFEIKLKK